jgi:membrane protein YdbS with pleckstrin-like domain
MSYIQQSLLPQESIVATTTLHPIIFWKPLRNAVLTLLVVGFGHWAAVGLFNDPAASPEAHAFLQTWVVGAVAGLLALVTVTGALLRLTLYATAEFGVTNKRVMAKVGILRRRSLEINLEKVESVTVNQSLLGRLLGYGTLRVRGTGSTDEILWGIAHAMQFRQHIQQLATCVPSSPPVVSTVRTNAATQPIAGAATQTSTFRLVEPRPGGRVYRLRSGSRIIIGRAPDNDIVIDDPTVSSTHAELREEGGHWVVSDLGSTNGTYVSYGGADAERRVEIRPLKDGSTVRFGDVSLRLER